MVDAPDELMVLGALWTAPDLPAVPEKDRGSNVLFLLGCYLGPPEKAEAVLKPLRTCKPVIADLTTRKTWLNVQKFFDEDYPSGRRYYWKSTLIKELTEPVIESLVRHAATRPSLLTSIDIWPMGGAFARVDPAETAFGSRDVRFTINYESNWGSAGALAVQDLPEFRRSCRGKGENGAGQLRGQLRKTAGGKGKI
jgi:hypothetical protein